MKHTSELLGRCATSTLEDSCNHFLDKPVSLQQASIGNSKNRQNRHMFLLLLFGVANRRSLLTHLATQPTFTALPTVSLRCNVTSCTEAARSDEIRFERDDGCGSQAACMSFRLRHSRVSTFLTWPLVAAALHWRQELVASS